ncbi:MAG: DUF4834 family protein [Winogradskyella sp.]|nr:DUF4834 family protein [Winogradskyella sp.]MBT8375867.1 DUF4834 family protein [Bacteroidia bacterium]NNC44606.1 DUF4834 family protein [Winogradskyella sp.]NNF86339.1 DUF4834 family protein [Winogradskyella sp.]
MLQTASAVGLLRTILIILLIYFGVKILARLLMPFFIRFVAKKTEERFGQQFGNYQDMTKKREKRKEGETVIDKVPNTDKSTNKDVGEYIDYEEID